MEINIKERNIEKANQIKKSTARLSIASNALLVVLKLIVGFSIGSVSIISEAIHSGIDLVAALIAYISVKKSSEPPDLEHRFGHGKFEDFSGFIEGALIFVAALIIIYEAARNCWAMARAWKRACYYMPVSASCSSPRPPTGLSPAGS